MQALTGAIGIKATDNLRNRISSELQIPLFLNPPERSFSVENEQFYVLATGTSVYYGDSSGLEALNNWLSAYISANRSIGQHLVELHGHFGLLVFDKQSTTVYLATDKMGTQPIYYSSCPAPARTENTASVPEEGDDSNEGNGSALFFSTGLNALRSIVPFKPVISRQGIFQYVYFHCIPAPDTIYKDIYKLKAGEILSFPVAGKNSKAPNVETYYLPEYQPSVSTSEPLEKRLYNGLENSVKRALDGLDKDKTGAFLSGGLDSSTVSGFFARTAGPGKAKTFTIGFHAEGYDESGFAKITADHFDTDHHVYYVTPENVQEALEDISAYYDEPFGNSSALPAYYCAKYAKSQGVTTLLAGDGGDELFAGNERYAKQKVFELYYTLPAPIRKVCLEWPLSLVPEESGIPLFGKAASYVRQARIPLPDRLQTYNFLHRFDPHTVFTENMLEEVDQQRPVSLQRARYTELNKADTLTRMLYLDWKFTLADNDLVKVTNMCHLAGVEVRYPMLDDELVNLSMEVPSELKLPKGQLRQFYKDSTRGFLPDATLNKSKKGFGLPFGVWIKEHEHLRELAYSNVRDLARTGLFREDFLEHAIEKHSSDHPGYYGELIWILMMLNLWLKAHED